MAPGEFRLRVCYHKMGRLRFLSHLEVMRAIERGARRAGLPYAVTRGFNPHMKMAFGPALPVGTSGEREYVDIWLSAYLPAEEAFSRFEAAMPTGLKPVQMRYVGSDLPSLSAACTIAVYEITVAEEEVGTRSLTEALDAVVRSGELIVEQKGKKKIYDLTRSLSKETCVRPEGSGIVVELATRMGQQGSMRPEALLKEALVRIGLSGVPMSVARLDILVEQDEGPVRPM